MGKWGLLFASLCLVVCGSGAVARAGDPSEEAKHHYEEGTKFFNLGEFKRSVAEYKAAYQAKPDPVFLYNIAQASRLDGDLTGALFFYRSYLRNVPNAPNKKEVTDKIATLEKQIQAQSAIANMPPATTLPPATTTPPAQPKPTVAAVTTPPATTTPPQPKPEPVVAKPQPKPEPVVAKPQPKPEPVVAKPQPKPEPKPEPALTATAVSTTAPAKTPIYKKWWLWTAVGGGLVAIGLGVGLGVALSGGPTPPASQYGTQPIF